MHDIGMDAIESRKDSYYSPLNIGGVQTQLTIVGAKSLGCVNCHDGKTRATIRTNLLKTLKNQARAYKAFWGSPEEEFIPDEIIIVPRRNLGQGEHGEALAVSQSHTRTIIVTPYTLIRDKLLDEYSLAHEFDHHRHLEAYSREVWAYAYNARRDPSFLFKIDKTHPLQAIKEAVETYVYPELGKKLVSMLDVRPGYYRLSADYDKTNNEIKTKIKNFDTALREARSSYDANLTYWDTWIRLTGYVELPIDVFAAKHYAARPPLFTDTAKLSKGMEITQKVMEVYNQKRKSAITRKETTPQEIAINPEAHLKENVLANLVFHQFTQTEALKMWYYFLHQKFVKGKTINYENVENKELRETIEQKRKLLQELIKDEGEKLGKKSIDRITNRLIELLAEHRRLLP